jgi:RNA polymerase primary sigma factor
VHQRLAQQLGRDPTDAELAAALDMPEPRLQEIRQAALVTSSIDQLVGHDEESTFADMVEDRSATMPEAKAAQDELRAAARHALDTALTDRERRVVELRYGLVDGERYQLERIGEQMGFTRERIRQIEVRALEKLRASRDARRLLAYSA